jgi:hypothetical protein
MASWSRRAFLVGLAVASAVGGTPWMRARRTGSEGSPILSLYIDEPYIDLRGGGLAYEARGFMHGVGPLRAWSEQQWRMHHPYI